eukprot:scaffold2979_cov243-Pinguiococcus_pyrenoidosus.AAC.20
MIRPVAMRSRSWPTSRASDRMSWRASMSSATSCAVWPPSSCSSRRMLSSAPTMSSADTSSRRTSPSRLASPARRRIASAARRIESRARLRPHDVLGCRLVADEGRKGIRGLRDDCLSVEDVLGAVVFLKGRGGEGGDVVDRAQALVGGQLLEVFIQVDKQLFGSAQAGGGLDYTCNGGSNVI